MQRINIFGNFFSKKKKKKKSSVSNQTVVVTWHNLMMPHGSMEHNKFEARHYNFNYMDRDKDIWENFYPTYRKKKNLEHAFPKDCRSFFELLEVLFSEGSGFRCALFATVAWCLWQQRNKLRVQQQTWQLHEIGDRVKALVQEFWDANHREQ